MWDSIVLNEEKVDEGRELKLFDSSQEVDCGKHERYYTHVEEIDRVFGGGIYPASAVLIGGEPGIGKSTLALQVASFLKEETLYVSGEESVAQVTSHIKRINISTSKLYVAHTSSVQDIIKTLLVRKNIKVLIIDSIQTMCTDENAGYKGSINQIKMCTNALIDFAKEHNVVLFIIGHITKEGQIAGPKLLEHMVDTVLYFEGDNLTHLRILRTIKNRFGSVQEIGVFEMTPQGLKSISNPSLLFLNNDSSRENIGSSVYAGIEGSRSLLVEIQTLVLKTYMNIPRRAVVGWDNNRLSMMLAVLTSKCSLNFDNKEVYLNVAGGIKVQETAADLAICAALISALLQKPLPARTAIFGEVSLSGEVRKVPLSELRIREATRLGFARVIIPNEQVSAAGIEIKHIGDISELKKLFYNPG